MPETVRLALGRLFRMAMGDVPFDAVMYEKCRAIIMDAAGPNNTAYVPAVSWARDRLKGSQGD